MIDNQLALGLAPVQICLIDDGPWRPSCFSPYFLNALIRDEALASICELSESHFHLNVPTGGSTPACVK